MQTCFLQQACAHPGSTTAFLCIRCHDRNIIRLHVHISWPVCHCFVARFNFTLFPSLAEEHGGNIRLPVPSAVYSIQARFRQYSLQADPLRNRDGHLSGLSTTLHVALCRIAGRLRALAQRRTRKASASRFAGGAKSLPLEVVWGRP